MGAFRLPHGDDALPAVGGESRTKRAAATMPAQPPFVMTFVLSILKAQVQGIAKYTSFVILIDHERKTHTVSTKLGTASGSYFPPDDGSPLRFHFGPPGPSRSGSPEAWSVAGGMGVYRVSIDVARQLAFDLRQLDTPAVLVGSPSLSPPASSQQAGTCERPVESEATREPKGRNGSNEVGMRTPPRLDGIMQYLDGQEMGYYAFPDLTLEGTIGVGGDERMIVGRAWMEHQWGDFPVGDYRWKYFAADLKLASGKRAQILAFEYARRTVPERRRKTASSQAEDGGSQGLLIRDGAVEVLSGLQIDEDESDGGRYATRNTLAWGRTGSAKRRLTFEAIFPDQECRTGLPESVFPVFWEGACRVEGRLDESEIKPAESWAIMELAGFD